MLVLTHELTPRTCGFAHACLGYPQLGVILDLLRAEEARLKGGAGGAGWVLWLDADAAAVGWSRPLHHLLPSARMCAFQAPPCHPDDIHLVVRDLGIWGGPEGV